MSGSRRIHPSKEAMDLVAMGKEIGKGTEVTVVGMVAVMVAIQLQYRVLALLSNPVLQVQRVQQITVPRWLNITEAKIREFLCYMLPISLTERQICLNLI